MGIRTGRRRWIRPWLLWLGIALLLFWQFQKLWHCMTHDFAEGSRHMDSEEGALKWLPTRRDPIVSKRTIGSKNPYKHIVFLGDSLLRYSSLEWLDQVHFERGGNDFAPKKLIHEKYHDSWFSYFNFSTEHFEGYMSCDCRRAETFNLGKEVENRYYRNPSNLLSVTYIQGYGDNQAHGRYALQDVYQAVITNDTDTSPYKWGFMGPQWDQLLRNQIPKEPRPTAIVLNAGLWPNDKIAANLGKILQAARDVVGPTGTIIWRSTVKRRSEKVASISTADKAAQDWTYRVPGFIYQPFPNHFNLTDADYFDENHFSEPHVYRQWNEDLRKALESPVKKHRVFIVVGAVRTLAMTEESIVKNLLFPLCPPSSCVAHVVMHFSMADNRPDVNNDPRGRPLNTTNVVVTSFFNRSDVPGEYLRLHWVNGYEIGSQEEQNAMDVVEMESEAHFATRLRMFRVADPRRYSMWFARAWAWRFVRSLSDTIAFDFYVFTRPDMFWMLPVPTAKFFFDFKLEENDVWLQDTYFGDVPDTFAFLPNSETAEMYFSLENLVHISVACLGGPTFNRSVAEKRLSDARIKHNESDWCVNELQGWSEKILKRKLNLAGLNIRYFPAAAVIFRPPLNLECASIDPVRHIPFATHPRSHVGHLACRNADALFHEGHNVSTVLSHRPFQIRSQTNSSLCLTRTRNDTVVTVAKPKLCSFPVPPEQLFVSSANEQIIGYEYKPRISTKLIDVVIDLEDNKGSWEKEPCELYGKETLHIMQ